MTTQQRINIIKQFPLFKELKDAEMTNFAESAKEKIFPSHTIILSPNHTVDGVYLIYKGLLEIYLLTSGGKHIPIRIRGSYYIASERNIIGQDRKVAMETLQETHALLIPKTICKDIVMKHPKMLFALLEIVVGKLQVIHEQIENYYSLSLKNRIMNMFNELTPFFPDNLIAMSHEEIANLVGATRPRVTEALQELRQEEKIRVENRKIKIVPKRTD